MRGVVMTKRLVTIDQLAAYLNVKKSWIYDRTYRDQIPVFRLGKLLRFDLDAIEAWLSDQARGPDPKICTPMPPAGDYPDQGEYDVS